MSANFTSLHMSGVKRLLLNPIISLFDYINGGYVRKPQTSFKIMIMNYTQNMSQLHSLLIFRVKPDGIDSISMIMN